MSLLLLFRPRGADSVVIGGRIIDDGGDAIGPRPRRRGITLDLVEDRTEGEEKPTKKRKFILPKEVRAEALNVFAEDKVDEMLEKLSRQVVERYAKDDLENEILVKESAIFRLWVQVKREEIVLAMFAVGGFD